MKTRLALTLLTVAVALQLTRAAAPQTPAPSPQPSTPTFRVGTDLLTVDVSVVDSAGRPIEGLTPADFTIKIDGKARKISALELATPVSSENTSGAVAGKPGVTLTQSARPRYILFTVDQLYIPTGSIKPLMESSARFLDQLAPNDRVGFIAFPVGPHVDFTTDKNKVREAMREMVGMPAVDHIGRMAIGIAEARIITDKERYLLDSNQPPTEDRTPITLDVFERNCANGASANENEICKVQVVNQAAEVAQQSRTDAKASVSTLESIIRQLAPVDGSKSLILISAALATEEQRDLDRLERLAAASRTSFNVLIVDPLADGSDSGLNQPDSRRRGELVTAADDRRIRLEGLEEIAADGRGAVYRVAGNGAATFTRLATELSASYVVGLDSLPEDLGKDRRKVDVIVNRPGARIRTAQASIITATTAAATAARGAAPSAAATVRDGLAATTEAMDVPLRVATFTRWDAASDKVRLNLAASIGQPGDNPNEFVVGYAVTDAQNKTVATAEQRPARPTGAARSQATPYGVSLLVDPGVYSVRLNVVNRSGQRSTVIRQVNATRTATDDLGTSDLIIGDAPPQGQGLTPAAEPHVSSGKLAAYLELYSTKPDDLDWTFVHIDVAKDETSEAIATEETGMVSGAQPTWRVASGVVSLEGLPPGAYVARARIIRDDKTLRVLTRPFVIEAPAAAPPAR